MINLFDLIIELPNLIMLIKNGLFLDILALLKLSVLKYDALGLLAKLVKLLLKLEELLVTLLCILDHGLLESLDDSRTFILLLLIFLYLLSKLIFSCSMSLLQILELIHNLVSLSSCFEKLELLFLKLILKLSHIG